MNCQGIIQKSLDKLADKPNWVLLGLLIIISAYLYRYYVFQRFFFLFADAGSDTIEQFWPTLMLLSDKLKQGDLTLWSFQAGIGTNLIANPMLLDPFNWPLLFLGKYSIADGLFYMAILKILCAGLFFHVYLRMAGISGYPSVIASLLYSFSGYMVVWGTHYNFGTALVYVPLVLGAFERGMKQSKWTLLPIASGVMAAFAFYFFFMFSIFFAVYVLLRVFEEKKGLDAGRSLITTGLYYALGISLSAVVLVPYLAFLSSSPRITPGNVHVPFLWGPNYWISTITRIFSDTGIYFSGNTGVKYDSWFYESANIYCGLLPLLMLPQLLANQNNRERVLWLGMIAVLAIFITFPVMTYVFNAFADMRLRWTFVIIPFLLFALARSLGVEREKYNCHLLTYSAIGLFAGYCLIVFWGGHYFQFDSPRWRSVISQGKWIGIFLALYTSVLVFRLPGGRREWYLIGLTLLTCGEIMIFHQGTIAGRVALERKGEYVKDVRKFITNIKSITEQLDDPQVMFYRIQKNFSISFAPVDSYYILGFNSTTAYLSVNQPSYLAFLKAFELDQPSPTVTRNIPPDRHRLLSLLGVKYILVDERGNLPYGFEFVKRYDNDQVPVYREPGFYQRGKRLIAPMLYENKYYLPFGFTYDRYISEDDFNGMSAQEKEIAIIKAFVATDAEIFPSDIRKLEKTEALSGADEKVFEEDVLDRKQATLKLGVFRSDYWAGTIKNEKHRMLCLAIPYDPGWSAWSNGARMPIKKINAGLMGILLRPGEHHVEMKYTPCGGFLGVIVTMLGGIIYIGVNIANRKRVCAGPPARL